MTIRKPSELGIDGRKRRRRSKRREEGGRGRAWETSTNSRLVTPKMLWAREPPAALFVCTRVREFMSEGEPTD